MQMNEQVLTALEVLKNFAENDFELHRIDVLINDLTAPPQVEIIDDTHQTFNGVKYRLDKSKHFVNNSASLHRAVYYYYFGEIPKGYVIHHKDLNPANNDISNLQLLTKSFHHKLHNDIVASEKICIFCGKKYIAQGFSESKFCSSNCRHKYYLHKNSIKKQPVEKICPICGKTFKLKYPSSTNKCCSRACSFKLTAKKNRKTTAEKICPVCGKIFKPKYPSSRAVCCSRTCGYKLSGENRKNNISNKKQHN